MPDTFSVLQEHFPVTAFLINISHWIMLFIKVQLTINVNLFSHQKRVTVLTPVGDIWRLEF